ncbi:hypothetical protein FOA52_002180 [Chlamydomonas sp. UWO 241]|nr:hypothetical protein FOA52_002180 [Chlamydomonas sp. UWO 241]
MMLNSSVGARPNPVQGSRVPMPFCQRLGTSMYTSGRRSGDAVRRSQRVCVRAVETKHTPGNVIGPVPVDDTMLAVPNIRHRLIAQPSPFCVHNNFGGGFVSDGDGVALNSMKFASYHSAGCTIAAHDAAVASAAVGGASLTPATPLAPGTSAASTNSLHEDAAIASAAIAEASLVGTSLIEASMDQLGGSLPLWALRAGARDKIYFDPKQVTAAIVTCGGLCPGLNDVVAGLVNKLATYGVPDGNILGIRYGFRGFYDTTMKPIILTPKTVDGIQLEGGTVLGTSRGGANMKEIVKRIDMWGIDMLFVVGGNGGNAGANAIDALCQQHEVNCCVVGIPKSIDNDILLIDKCFGFDTAVEESQRALLAAKVEASSAKHGIGLVKLMGRSSGFIALQASMASGVVDAVLIPEVPFKLKGLMKHLEGVLKNKGHCVLCVAEGAGQDMLGDGTDGKDASGNPILKDIGTFLKKELKEHFQDADIKYIDPTYMIRAIPTTSGDRIYCKILAHNAVHAAFSGYTGLTVGLVNTHYCYLPIPVVISAPRKVDPRGKAWNRLRATIGQPNLD